MGVWKVSWLVAWCPQDTVFDAPKTLSLVPPRHCLGDTKTQTMTPTKTFSTRPSNLSYTNQECRCSIRCITSWCQSAMESCSASIGNCHQHETKQILVWRFQAMIIGVDALSTSLLFQQDKYERLSTAPLFEQFWWTLMEREGGSEECIIIAHSCLGLY